MTKQHIPLGLVLMIIMLGMLLAPSTARACSTPVHRYAMYNWQPSVYTVVLFHKDGKPEELPISKRLLKMADYETSITNIAFRPLDVSDPEVLKNVPREVREAYEANKDRELPFHMVFSPRGVLLHVSRLDDKTIDALTTSPLRKRVAELLQNGNHGALLFVPGTDADRNTKALAEIKKAVELSRKRIPLMEQPTPSGFEIIDEESPAPKKETEFSLEVVTLKRDDKTESMLLEQLYAVEKLEPEEKAMPLVFGLYGRGRALEPYLGDGIEAENLFEMIAFMNGPCSCEVKDQNPGVDLLVSWDWHKAAVAMAQRIGRESGNEMLLEEIGFQEMMEQIDQAADAKTAEESDTPATGTQESEVAIKTSSGEKAEISLATDTAESTTSSETPVEQPAGAAETSAVGTRMSFGLILLAAIGCAGVLLAIITIFLVKKP